MFEVYEPGHVVFHHKEYGIELCAGSAAGTQAVINIWYQAIIILSLIFMIFVPEEIKKAAKRKAPEILLLSTGC